MCSPGGESGLFSPSLILHSYFPCIHLQVNSLAWPNLYHRSRMHHTTLYPSQTSVNQPESNGSSPKRPRWTTRSTVIYNQSIADNLRSNRFVARQVGPTWARGCMPVLDLNEDRLLVATGATLVRFDLSLGPTHNKGLPVPGIGKVVSSARGIHVPLMDDNPPVDNLTGRQQPYKRTAPTAFDDITGLVELSDGQIVTSTVNGTLQRLKLDSNRAISTARYGHRVNNNPIESLSVSKSKSKQEFVLSAAHDGRLSLFSPSSPWIPPSTIATSVRPWCTHLNLEAPSPFAAVGVSGQSALRLHTVRPTGLFEDTGSSTSLSGPLNKKSAVYGVTCPSADISLPYTAHPSSLLLSAWYDGYARFHDLRLCDTGDISYSRPVMEMTDPWTDTALYSCDFVGLGQVVAGSARHAMLSIWDPRMIRSLGGGAGANSAGVKNGDKFIKDPTATASQWKGGWSMFAPGRDESPVYQVKGDGGRIWGVTSHRAFVLAFDVTGQEDEESSRGWDVVLPAVRPSPSIPSRWTPGNAGIGRKPTDFSTGYKHEDVTVKLFNSLNVV